MLSIVAVNCYSMKYKMPDDAVKAKKINIHGKHIGLTGPISKPKQGHRFNIDLSSKNWKTAVPVEQMMDANGTVSTLPGRKMLTICPSDAQPTIDVTTVGLPMCRLYIPVIGGGTASCTAWFYNNQYAITAAHCIMNYGSNTYFVNWNAAAAEQPKLCCGAKADPCVPFYTYAIRAFVVPYGYAHGYGDGYDGAVLKIVLDSTKSPIRPYTIQTAPVSTANCGKDFQMYSGYPGYVNSPGCTNIVPNARYTFYPYIGINNCNTYKTSNPPSAIEILDGSCGGMSGGPATAFGVSILYKNAIYTIQGFSCTNGLSKTRVTPIGYGVNIGNLQGALVNF